MGIDPFTLAAGAAIGSALLGSSATTSAADTMASSNAVASAQQMAMFKSVNEQNKPYRDAANTSLSQLTQETGTGGALTPSAFKFEADPGYQWILDQGQRAINASAAAKGGVLGGGVLKTLTDYNQGEAGTQYTNAFNRFQTQSMNRYNMLAGIAGLGQASNTTTAAASNNAANAISANTVAAGNAIASGTIGSTNAITGGLSNLSSMYMQKNMMNQMYGSGSGANITTL